MLTILSLLCESFIDLGTAELRIVYCGFTWEAATVRYEDHVRFEPPDVAEAAAAAKACRVVYIYRYELGMAR
jgi:hypothetical protein